MPGSAKFHTGECQKQAFSEKLGGKIYEDIIFRLRYGGGGRHADCGSFGASAGSGEGAGGTERPGYSRGGDGV